MFDRNSMLCGAAAAAVGMSAGAMVMTNMVRADPPPVPDLGKMAEAVQAERDVLDFTVPDLSEPETGAEISRHGCAMPALPQWADDLPPTEARRSLLLKDLYNIGRQQAIIETNSCPCEIEFPSWEEAERQYQELTADKDRDDIFELAGQVGREAGKTLKASLDICKAWRGR
ncbi:hypothetical protein [Paracoccus rhizosphaerae]|uniref:Uncharacterized protein n=1 Tax=Paracoccus rhizosphaerae TaxID=1133347 RepID=A0ABV6CE24_9RHOB|nr:hypothetical protein [Paracoccus rhizosphaerae]